MQARISSILAITFLAVGCTSPRPALIDDPGSTGGATRGERDDNGWVREPSEITKPITANTAPPTRDWKAEADRLAREKVKLQYELFTLKQQVATRQREYDRMVGERNALLRGSGLVQIESAHTETEATDARSRTASPGSKPGADYPRRSTTPPAVPSTSNARKHESAVERATPTNKPADAQPEATLAAATSTAPSPAAADRSATPAGTRAATGSKTAANGSEAKNAKKAPPKPQKIKKRKVILRKPAGPEIFSITNISVAAVVIAAIAFVVLRKKGGTKNKNKKKKGGARKRAGESPRDKTSEKRTTPSEPVADGAEPTPSVEVELSST